MGHVDHGKTTLLDFIRKTRVAEREAGGITQSIGAYEIEHNGRQITFIDTPGHEAFANMRSHSARVADLAILVVAADDGVKPQTLNALQFITEEKIPYVVAFTKIDKQNADVERAKQSLVKAGVYLEGLGGNVPYHAISGKTGEGIPELLDLVLLASDVEDISADSEAIPQGVVLMSRLDPRKGIIVGGIVKDGTLRQNELIATETAKGKVKTLSTFLGKQVKELSPSSPAFIMGFDTLPEVGERFFAGESAENFCKKEAGKKSLIQDIPEGALPIIMKADETGSLEALRGTVCRKELPRPIVVLRAEVGDIYEGDVKLAKTSGALILGFRVKVDKAAENMGKNEQVPMLISNIIYELAEALEKLVKGESSEMMRAFEIIKIFGEPKGKEYVLGGRVTKGIVNNQEEFELWKGEKKIGSGRILNLQTGKEDVGSVDKDVEAGMLVECSPSPEKGMTLRFRGE